MKLSDKTTKITTVIGENFKTYIILQKRVLSISYKSVAHNKSS